MTAQENLIARIRELLVDEPVQREVAMFGGRSFMVNEKMIVSATKNGGLLVRVAAEQHDELVQRAGAHQAEMGIGRTMGPGWIHVDNETIQDDNQLAFWIDTSLAYNRAVTGCER